MPQEVEGIYAAYMTGSAGQGFAMFTVRDGLLVGADPMGVLFDGSYTTKPDGTGYEGKIAVKIPPNGTTIQGVSVGPHGLSYEVAMTMPLVFTDQDTLKIPTPLGPVNLRMVKVRGW